MNRVLYVAAIAAFAIVCFNAKLDAAVMNITEGSTTGYTMTDGNTYVIQNSVTFSNSTIGGSGMTVAENATVVIYIPQGVTLTARGRNSDDTFNYTCGGAGIRVPATATLIITGEGSVTATGGNAGNGGKGGQGGAANYTNCGSGGYGGTGGGGAGAAIGGVGGTGGGGNGGAGDSAETMGNLYILGTVASVNVSGSGGKGGGCGELGKNSGSMPGGAGGGGGGAGSSPSCAIGGGGSSGGSGGKGLDGAPGRASVTGGGGRSKTESGVGSAPGSGYAGGAYGAEGGAGTLYVSSTATVDVNRTILSAETHPAAQYAMVFDANGGSITSVTSTTTATLGCALPDCIPTPTRNGYSFVGWAADQHGTTMWYGPDGTKSLSSYTTTANTTLYAIWQLGAPTISPVGGVVSAWPVSVTISSAVEGAAIHYTTDDSEPTEESAVYRRFRISGRTTVKAIAVKDGLCSDVAVADYAGGVCETPVIAAQSSFTGSKTAVTLSCATEGATIRYTLDGTEPCATSDAYTETFFVTDGCTIKAKAFYPDFFDSAVATQSIEKVWAVGDTVGAPDHTFATGGDLPFVRVTDNTAPLGESMKSGAITHSQTSTLSTTVIGPGTISFQWKASCEDSGGEYDWDHAEFWVDGTRIAQLDGETSWQTVTQAISGNGSHTLLWKYVKDEVESEGEDCCWVADYHWASAYTETQTTPAHVPYVWLRTFYPETPDEYDFYEAAAKEDAANGVNKVWECYVAGLNPTNATDVFRAVISIGGDGEPVVGWEPDLNEGGKKQERVYTVEGRESLTDGDWGPTNAASRFFRVKVGMP